MIPLRVYVADNRECIFFFDVHKRKNATPG